MFINSSDLDRAKAAMEAAGFVYRHSAGMDMFLDGPGGNARSAVHVIFSGEKARPTDLAAIPDVANATSFTHYASINLEGLVTMKLIAFRRKDQVHLLDMIGVGLDRRLVSRETSRRTRRPAATVAGRSRRLRFDPGQPAWRSSRGARHRSRALVLALRLLVCEAKIA